MEEFTNMIYQLVAVPHKASMLVGCVILFDIMTGYIKAFKNKNFNSSISRDGYLKKLTWVIALIFGLVINYLANTPVFLIGVSITCFFTELLSAYENMGELGIELKFLSKYFDKLNNKDGE